MKDLSDQFWRSKALSQMSRSEWESLCDGCARCCLIKLEEEANAVHYTAIVCRYLDQEICDCTRYKNRTNLVSDCVHLTPITALEYDWLPDTCAYRLVAEGKELYPWHHLISGSKETVHTAGISVRGKCVSEEHVHPDGLEEHVIRWVRQSGADNG